MDFIPRKTFSELIDEFRFRMYAHTKRTHRSSGILSGIDKLDTITKGFQPSNLILIGGVAGMGKTSFALSLIRKIAIEKQCQTVYFSLELTSQQVMYRIISQLTNISAEKLRMGSLNENESELVAKKTFEFKNTPLDVYDHPFLTVSEIENTLLCSPPDFVPIIIIDSLQLISKNKKEEVGKILNKRELAKITFQLKQLAVKFNATIIVLFHFRLPKEKEKYYYSKRPTLADVRKYAPIDTYADLVLLLYRPEYYKIEEWDDEEQAPTAGEAEIIVAKNTNGSLDTIRVKFDGSKGLFDNLSYYNKID
jgi:replicative DNA helicase